ncbi:hypothetical protein ACIRA0001_0039 [Acinetobacter radioresistens SK82]|uniref:Integrase catalytic domain-containing protein n=1 Tax=Acinetobacter radioresistens SK82 TaxID=596318 RepID=A0ABP2GJ72_ACIRA|nr:hypothetical protein ACIRA0001_0039 [Acinetobacter radioresistens SK82]EXB88122.1 hypothetical protein J538_0228 [Acinetobacter sp. 272263]
MAFHNFNRASIQKIYFLNNLEMMEISAFIQEYNHYKNM